MGSFGKWLGRLLLTLIAFGGLARVFAPQIQVDAAIAFDESALPADLDAWLADRERQVPDIVPGAEKRIVWAGKPGDRTPLSIVYLHGFSATAEEIRPVPDLVAKSLGANLFYTRLSGHGRTGAALAKPAPSDWIADLAEAMAIGRRIGGRVLVIATSTGGTLAAIAATEPVLSDRLAGVVFVSPNFGLAGARASLLDLPLARWWVPVVAGRERNFPPLNEAHARFWTTRYPTVALFAMVELVRHVRVRDFGRAKVPALFIYSEQDQVVSAWRSRKVISAWGGPVRAEPRVMGPGDDPTSHVIAGDAFSPGQTVPTVEIVLDWAEGL